MDNFVCVLDDGETLTFDSKCTYVEYSNDNLCVFMHQYGASGVQETLALIPYSRIKKIIRDEKS